MNAVSGGIIAIAASMGVLATSVYLLSESGDDRLEAATDVVRADETLAPESRITAENAASLVQTASTQVTEPQFVVWSRDGNGLYVVAAGRFGFFGLDDRQLQVFQSISPTDMVLSVSSGGVVAVLQDATVVLRDGVSGDDLHVLALDAPVNSAAFSSDGQKLALVLEDGEVLRTFDVVTGAALGEHRLPEQARGAYSAEFAPGDGSAIWFSPSEARVLDLESGMFGPVLTFSRVMALSTTVNDVAGGPDSGLLVATADDVLTVWDPATATVTASREGVGANSLSVSDDGGFALITTESETALLDPGSLELVHSIPEVSFDAVFSPRGDALALVGVNGVLSIWQPD